jgi:hypothetical protein
MSSGASGSTRFEANSSYLRCQVELRETNKNEKFRQLEAERRQGEAEGREMVAYRLVEENTKLIATCQKEAADAFAFTQAKLQTRVRENQHMRKALDSDLQGIDATIDRTKKTMAETSHQINSLQEPAESTATCASWRNQRAIVEHITDPVFTQLQAHRANIFQAQQQLVEHHMGEKNHLRNLKDRRSRLKEDLKDKTLALQIDTDCLSQKPYGKKTCRKYYLSKSSESRRRHADANPVPQASSWQ